MKGNEKIVRTFQVEELGEGELRRLIHWGQHYMEGGERQFDDDADESDAILLEELRVLLSAEEHVSRLVTSESDADASESVSEARVKFRDPDASKSEWDAGRVIDGGSGMIWRERD